MWYCCPVKSQLIRYHYVCKVQVFLVQDMFIKYILTQGYYNVILSLNDRF